MITEDSPDNLVREADLYDPVKAFLQARGYRVKGEIGRCDVVAVGGGGEVVIVELKTGFTLPLVLQGIRRQSMTHDVYVAFAEARRGAGVWRRRRRDRSPGLGPWRGEGT